jgi:hypothetical protein
MKKVSPHEFRDAFLAALRGLNEEFKASWLGRSADYTAFFRGKVLPNVANRLGLKAHCSDYYTLDAVFYSESDAKYFPPSSTYARCLAVAIEHENAAATSYIEMNKLQLFNAPLKVLITYARSGRETEKLLAMYDEIISWADCFGDIASLRRQLVILGEPGAVTSWRFFAYDQGGLAPLEDV